MSKNTTTADTRSSKAQQLAEVAPELAKILNQTAITSSARFSVSAIRCEKVMIPMRDGTLLATDLYFPPVLPAPAIAIRTPYSKSRDAIVGSYIALARRGYAVVAQDCRATGESEPDSWDYYMYESEDGYDLVEWVSQQEWFDGFLGAIGGSYTGQTQWPMALHPKMSTIVPEVSGLGVAINTIYHHAGFKPYALTVGKGPDKVLAPDAHFEERMQQETLATGFFNSPLHKPFSQALLQRFPNLRELPPLQAKRWLWEKYCSLPSAERAKFMHQAMETKNVTLIECELSSTVFGIEISHDAHTIPHPNPLVLCGELHAPALVRTGWYDWGINDALETWEYLMKGANERVRSRSRLFIGPNAHGTPGYLEGMAEHPELRHNFSLGANFELFFRWYGTIRENDFASWPTVVYYLMGANEWRHADAWPIPGTQTVAWYLDTAGTLSSQEPSTTEPDRFTYDPNDPTPNVEAASVDVSSLQDRPDVLSYTSPPLAKDLDVVGALRCVLYASSSAVDTDFFVRLSDVYPDGRALWVQSGRLQTRYRDLHGEPELLEPGQAYRFEIDMWATATRFKAGHRLRVDICSADFPAFMRNANRGGEPGTPITATQTIYHDREHPSHILLPIL